MSLVRLYKLRMIGPLPAKAAAVADLQAMGCLMLTPLKATGDAQAGAPHRQVYESLTFLLSCPRRRPQVSGEAGFDAGKIQKEALDLQKKLLALEDERDAVTQRLRDLAPFGDFSFPPLEEMGGQRLWFYAVPHRLMPRFEAMNLRWKQVNKDDANRYVVVVSDQEPKETPVERVASGSLSPAQLRQRLEELHQLIEDAREQRYSLTRWGTQFVRHLNELENHAAREEASRQMLDTDPLFGLEAWAPQDQLETVRRCGAKHGLVVEAREPAADDTPPTLMKNRKGLDAGEALVTFYMTPGYSTWDPSSVVLFSFAIFFAMILSDAGYAALMGVLLVVLWKGLSKSDGGRRGRTLLLLLTGASIIYGVMVGSYFGVAPAKESLPGRLAFLNVNDANMMMSLSVVIGVIHLVIANLMNAKRCGWRQEALAPLGWTGMILGGFLVPASEVVKLPTVRTIGFVLAGCGALLVLLFSGAGKKPVGRMVSGLLAFTKVTGAFGDILSYLRLFALGLASASLAVAFNDMAGQIRGLVPGIGLLFALLVLLIGHGLNLILSLSSAVIHGLRLNVIEFFNWGLPEEGRPYVTFAKKEQHSWTR